MGCEMRVFRVGLLSFFLSFVVALARNLAGAENLETGKPGPKLFSSNCSMCHSSPRVLQNRMNHWALMDFLQKHYTASQTAAHELAGYLLAVRSHSSPGKRQPLTKGDDPQRFLAIQSTTPVERPPESVPTR